MSSLENPFKRFEEIMSRAEKLGLRYPNACVLSTVSSEGEPSSRFVLLKGFDQRGFVFYTNLESRKGQEIEANPNVALAFFWESLGDQVRIQGTADLVSNEEADAYFATRDRGSQLGAWASRQSREMSGRAQLLAEVAKVEARHVGRSVPRPPHWSGFRVNPFRFEFWVEGRFRLHQRTEYVEDGGAWRRRTLFP